jgi:hypothetical protein
MKKIFLAALTFAFAASALAQTEVTNEGGTKILKGFITKQDLAGDAAFPGLLKVQKLIHRANGPGFI